MGRVEQFKYRPQSLQSLTYLLFGLVLKKFANLCSRGFQKRVDPYAETTGEGETERRFFFFF